MNNNNDERVEIYGERLREIREYFALSLDKFGEKIGLSGSRLSKLERETDKVTLSKEVHDRLIDVFQVNPTYLTVSYPAVCKMIMQPKKRRSNKSKSTKTNITEETVQQVNNDDVVSEHTSDDIADNRSNTKAEPDMVDDNEDPKYGFTTDSPELKPSDLYDKLTEDISEPKIVNDEDQKVENPIMSDSFYNTMEYLSRMSKSLEQTTPWPYSEHPIQSPALQMSQQFIPQTYTQAPGADLSKIVNILAKFDQDQMSAVLTFVKYMKETNDSPKAIKSLIKALKSFKSIKIVL